MPWSRAMRAISACSALPLGTGLGKSRREDDDAADAALRAARDRIENAGARDREHGAIDAVRQRRRGRSRTAAR